MFFGQASARRSTGLHGLELATALDAAADVVDHLAERRAHGHLDESDVVDLSGQGKHLCPF